MEFFFIRRRCICRLVYHPGEYIRGNVLGHQALWNPCSLPCTTADWWQDKQGARSKSGAGNCDSKGGPAELRYYQFVEFIGVQRSPCCWAWVCKENMCVLFAVLAAIPARWSKRVGSHILSILSHFSPTKNISPDATYDWTVPWIVLLTLELILLCLLIRLLIRSWTFFRFLMTWYSARLLVRAFAPCRSSPEGANLPHSTVRTSRTHAREQGFGAWALKVAEEHPYSDMWKKSFRTQFLKKWLVNPPTASVVK